MLMESKILETTLDNAWLAATQQYFDSPNESTRIAMNTVAGIIREVKRELFAQEQAEQKKRRSIELREWIEWLKEYA